MSKKIQGRNDRQNAANTPPKEPKKAPPAEGEITTLKGAQRAVPVVLFALAIFVTLCFFMENTGTVGRVFNEVLLGLFSFTAYLIPVLLMLHAIFYASDVQKKRRLSRLVFSVLTLVFLSSVVYAVEFFGQDVPFTPGEYYTRGTERAGGGFVGSVVAFAITKVFGSVGLIIIALLVLALYVTFFFSKEGSTLVRFGLKCLTAVLTVLSLIERGIKWLLSGDERRKEKKRERTAVQQQRELLDDEFFDVDNGLCELQIPALGISQVRDARSVEENPTLHERVIHEDVVHTGASYSSPLEETVSESVYEAFIVDPEIQREDAPSAHTAPHAQGVAQAETATESPLQSEAPSPADNSAPQAPPRATCEQPYTPPSNASVPPHNEPSRSAPLMQDLDAEDVFTSDFDPFDIERNRAFARRTTPTKSAGSSPAAFHESIENISEEEIEQLRRRQEFERRKAQMKAKSEQTPRESFTFDLGTSNGEGSPELELPTAYSPDPEVVPKPKLSSFTFDLGTPHASAASAGADAFTVTIDKTPKTPIEESEQVPGYGQSPTASAASSQTAPEGARGSFDFTSCAEEDDPFRRIADLVASGEHPELSRREEPKSEPKPELVRQEDTSPIGTILREFETEQGMRNEDKPEVRPFVPGEWTTSGFHAQNERPTLEVRHEIIEEPAEIIEEASDEANAPVEPTPIGQDTVPTVEEDADVVAPDAEEGEDEVVDISPEEEESVEDAYIPPERQNPKVMEQRNLFSFLRDDDPNAEDTQTPSSVTEDPVDEVPYEDEIAEDTDDEDEPPFDGATRTTSSRFAEYMSSLSRAEEKPKPKEEAPKPKAAPDYSSYKFPPIDILKMAPKMDDEDAQLEINSNAEKLIDTLESFRVQATIKGYDRGPRITRYEVVPARGVKVSAITNLFDNISLALAADGVRMEAPIPGKSAIGFEIPNRKPTNVYLRDLIESDEFQNSDSKTLVCMGQDVAGIPIYGDIAKMPHVLVAGATGMGKSVCINAMMLSILYRARPDEVKLIMIDPKKVEFQPYNGIPHLLVPVVIDPKQAAGALMWAVEEMEKRFDLIEQMKVKKIDDYNTKVRENPALGTPMPKIIIVIDELNDLMIQVRDPVENLIMRIAQKARAAGIHLIIGTQRPSVNVITGVIKANIPSRISCKVASTVDSRTILETAGAEKLLDRGDMLFFPVTRQKPLRVQGAFVSDTEVDKILDFLRDQAKGENCYDEEVLEQINRAASKCSKSKNDDEGEDDDDEGGEGYLNDQTFLDAVAVALNAGKISTSLLQRKLSIGFGRAAKYIDIMEDLGVVSERNGQKPRDVLINKQEWQELLARRSLD